MKNLDMKLADKFMVKTPLGRLILSKILTKAIYSNTGVVAKVAINDLKLDYIEGEDVKLGVNVSINLSEEEFIKLTDLI